MIRWLLAGAVTGVLLIGIWFAIGRNAQSGMNPASDHAPAPTSSEQEPEVAAIQDRIEQGEQIFEYHCSMCHASITDEVIVGPSLRGFFKGTPDPLQDGGQPLPQTDEAVGEMIKRGNSFMPPFGDNLTEQEISDVIAYLHSL